MKSKMQIQGLKIVIYMISLCLLSSALGCDAFIRKFTRKPKHEKESDKEIVLVPEEYRSNMSKEDYYRQYFLYWKSWHSELIESLSAGGNHKKQLGSVTQVVVNLESIRKMLNEEKQKKLDPYIDRMKDLKEAIKNDVYASNALFHRQRAEQIKMDILKYFSYNAVKDSLI